ncbi:MAG: dipeptidase [Acidimicrobiia bacterium]
MISELALRIHRDLPVVDGHNDLPWKIRTEAGGDLDKANPSSHLPDFHTDIPRMIEGGVGGQFWSVYVPCGIDSPLSATLAQIDLVERFTSGDERTQLVRTAAEARALIATGQIASLLGAEGGHSIEGSIANLQVLADRGVRYMTLTHSDNTEWADSATDEPVHGGLNSFGADVVREMNRLGILVDLSHVSADTMRHALDISATPVIASHSNARALAPHPRNIPDDVLREIGDQGGVVMVVFFSGFVVAETALQMTEMFDQMRQLRAELEGDEEAFAAEWDRRNTELDYDRGTVAGVADHIDYIAEIAGVQSVGLGSDFDGTPTTPVGLEDVSCFPAITDELLHRGWSEANVRKVLGENALRVLEVATEV